MPKSPHIVRISSALRASPAQLWQHSSSLRGINRELWPLHMSGPQDVRLGPAAATGEPLFRSVLSLLRVIALDLHEFRLVRVIEGEGFHESSRSLLERRWVHVRNIEPAEGGCVVSDELEFEPRVLSSLIGSVVRRVFERRHGWLRDQFGELSTRV